MAVCWLVTWPLIGHRENSLQVLTVRRHCKFPNILAKLAINTPVVTGYARCWVHTEELKKKWS